MGMFFRVHIAGDGCQCQYCYAERANLMQSLMAKAHEEHCREQDYNCPQRAARFHNGEIQPPVVPFDEVAFEAEKQLIRNESLYGWKQADDAYTETRFFLPSSANAPSEVAHPVTDPDDDEDEDDDSEDDINDGPTCAVLPPGK